MSDDRPTARAERPRLFLVDGTALAYRAFFAMGRSGLSTADGEPTGAVFGVANTIWSLLKEYRPEYLAVVFDTAAPTFRHEEYEAYKANREEMPDDLVRQLPLLAEMVTTWPLAHLAVDGVEADDVIGSYAVQLAGPELEVIMVTSDKDFCQLVNDDISILNPGRGGPAKVEAHRLDAAGVVAKFGVPPSQVIDVLSLMGDTSDNVPGVPGIGEKTAAQLVREFGSLETILASIDRIPRKSWAEKLVAYADQARLSRRLVTIRTSCPLPTPLSGMAVGRPAAALADFFRRMEFGRLTREAAAAAGARPDAIPKPSAETSPSVVSPDPSAKRGSDPPAAPRREGTPWGGTLDLFRTGLDDPLPAPVAGAWLTEAPPTDADYRLASDRAGLERLAGELRASHAPIAIDTETTGLDPMRAGLVGLSFATRGGTGWYVPVAHQEGPNASLADVRSVLGPILADPAIPKIGQNIKYDLVILDRHDLPVAGVAFDTMVASYLIDAGRSHKLDNLAHEELGYRMVP
ncbi:MAG: DNA polymerase I, partial [bacterium]